MEVAIVEVVVIIVVVVLVVMVVVVVVVVAVVVVVLVAEIEGVVVIVVVVVVVVIVIVVVVVVVVVVVIKISFGSGSRYVEVAIVRKSPSSSSSSSSGSGSSDSCSFYVMIEVLIRNAKCGMTVFGRNTDLDSHPNKVFRNSEALLVEYFLSAARIQGGMRDCIAYACMSIPTLTSIPDTVSTLTIGHGMHGDVSTFLSTDPNTIFPM